jgi:hypothetical protein
VRLTLRSSGLLRREASRTRVSQFASKLAEEQQRVVRVASSWRSCEDEAEDGRINVTCCIGLFYPYFTVFVVLVHMGILVLLMGL